MANMSAFVDNLEEDLTTVRLMSSLENVSLSYVKVSKTKSLKDIAPGFETMRAISILNNSEVSIKFSIGFVKWSSKIENKYVEIISDVESMIDSIAGFRNLIEDPSFSRDSLFCSLSDIYICRLIDNEKTRIGSRTGSTDSTLFFLYKDWIEENSEKTLMTLSINKNGETIKILQTDPEFEKLSADLMSVIKSSSLV